MSKDWSADTVLQLASSYQPVCVLAAAADLELFEAVGREPLTAAAAASKLKADLRGLTVLLNALVALELLDKRGDHYEVREPLTQLLVPGTPGSVLAMVQHQANCLRRWVQLAEVVKSGRPAVREPSVRGESADYEAFIEAMNVISGPMAASVVGELPELSFHHLLDVGGASGTWTIALLARCPDAKATIFDLPHVLPQAKARIARASLSQRVTLAAGDYLVDPLPAGADLVFLGAVVHSNSREQNRVLLANCFRALLPGGRILIRDVIMKRSRTTPAYGALFAVNMLVATEGGGTFTFDELREDLESAGFVDAELVRHDNRMNSVLQAYKPEHA
ncbi:MAG: methyltransferase [Planctomycetota bacterium]